MTPILLVPRLKTPVLVQTKGQNWLTITGSGGKQLSQAAGGCGCVDRKGAGLSPRGASCPQPSCLLFVLPSDPWNCHLLRHWEAVGHGDRRRHCVDRVRRVNWVTERVTGGLRVCLSHLRVAVSPCSGSGVSNDGGGHAHGRAVRQPVAGQRVEEGDARGGHLLDAAVIS